MTKKIEKKLRTTIYLPDDLKWRLREVAAKRRVESDTAAIETAIREWISRADTAAEIAANAQSRAKKGERVGA